MKSAHRIARFALLPQLLSMVVAGPTPASPADEDRPQRADPCVVASQHGDLPPGLKQRCPEATASGGVARGDFNGDGFGDLAVGVPFEDELGIGNSGGVNVIHGSANGLTGTNAQFWSQNSPGVPDQPEANDQFGSSLAAGDFDGDGYSDLAILAPNETEIFFAPAPPATGGAVQVIFGSPTGLSTARTPQRFFGSDFEVDGGGLSFSGASILTGTRNSLLWADFTGDGIGDLAIEAQRGDRSFVVLLRGQRPTGLTFNSILALPDSGFTDETGTFSDLTLSAGDFDGDGAHDLAVGVLHTASRFSRIEIYEGAGNGVLTTPSNLLPPGVLGIVVGVPKEVFREADLPGGGAANAGHFFGTALATGDFDGNQHDDLAIGEKPPSSSGPGKVWAVSSSTESLALGSARSFDQGTRGIPDDPEAGDDFGAALAANDFNGDGFNDLAIGVPGEDLGTLRDAGAVNVIHGSATGLAASGIGIVPAQLWTQDSAGIDSSIAEADDRFGAVLSSWNFGKGTQADLAIGVPREDVVTVQVSSSGARRTVNVVDAGMVNVLYGSTAGLAATGEQIWHQDSSGVPDSAEAGDLFGNALY